MKEAIIFSVYDQSNCRFYIWYYLKVSSSVLFVQEPDHYLLYLSILSSPFSSSTISKLSKYFYSNFISVQVSEPYKEMLQI